MLKALVVSLFLIGAMFEFVRIEREHRSLKLVLKPSSAISGTIFALIALLIWLFG